MGHLLTGIVVWTILFSFTACKRKTESIPGDMPAAIRLFNDTLSARLYLQNKNDSTLTAIGKNWFSTTAGNYSLRVFLDNRELYFKKIERSDEGSFSFPLPQFSVIMQHTLTVKQYKDSSIVNELSLEFNIPPSNK